MTTKTPMELADEIECEGIERVLYGKSHYDLVEFNRVLVSALRQSARREALLREVKEQLRHVHTFYSPCPACIFAQRIEQELGETS